MGSDYSSPCFLKSPRTGNIHDDSGLHASYSTVEQNIFTTVEVCPSVKADDMWEYGIYVIRSKVLTTQRNLRKDYEVHMVVLYHRSSY